MRGIADGFILIRDIGFLFDRHFRMGGYKLIIQEGDMADNSMLIGEDGGFISIAEINNR